MCDVPRRAVPRRVALWPGSLRHATRAARGAHFYRRQEPPAPSSRRHLRPSLPPDMRATSRGAPARDVVLGIPAFEW
eukprot:364429-Chlamydomonas_euryale.AAC.13